MALANCPECQKQISDTSKKCIGCGAEVKKCPECGILVTADSAVCPGCGYELEAEVAEVEAAPVEEQAQNTANAEEDISSQVATQRLINHIDSFKNENKGIKGCFWYSHKGSAFIPSLLFAFVIVGVLIAGLIGGGGVSGLAYHFMSNLGIILFAYLAIVFLITSPIGGITNTVERIHASGRFAEYCERNNIDLTRYAALASFIIPARPQNRNDTRPFDLNISKDAAYYASNPEMRTRYKVYSIIEMVVALMFSIAIGTYSLICTMQAMLTGLLGMSVGYFEILKSPTAIVLYVLLGCYLVYGIVSASIVKKVFIDKREEWFAKQLGKEKKTVSEAADA